MRSVVHEGSHRRLAQLDRLGQSREPVLHPARIQCPPFAAALQSVPAALLPVEPVSPPTDTEPISVRRLQSAVKASRSEELRSVTTVALPTHGARNTQRHGIPCAGAQRQHGRQQRGTHSLAMAVIRFLEPVSYDYGSTVVYQDDSVYIDGDVVGTSAEYAEQATEIAEAGMTPEATASVEATAAADHNRSR